VLLWGGGLTVSNAGKALAEALQKREATHHHLQNAATPIYY
jgi:hypothetical protein